MIVNVAKGIEDASLKLLSDILEEEMPLADIAVLSDRLMRRKLAEAFLITLVAGAKSKETAEYIQEVFMNNVLRVYTSPDITGIELGGA